MLLWLLLMFSIFYKVYTIMNSLILDIVQVTISVLLVGAIIMQNRGSGLGSAFGGDGNVYRTRRSFEKLLYRATIVLAVLLMAITLANAIIS